MAQILRDDEFRLQDDSSTGDGQASQEISIGGMNRRMHAHGDSVPGCIRECPIIS